MALTEFKSSRQYVEDKLRHGIHDLDEITDAYLEDALASENPREWLRVAVRSDISSIHRGLVRALEREITSWDPADVPGENGHGATTMSAARAQLLDEGCYVPGQGWLTWGEMTADDHRAKVEHIRRQISGLQQSLRLHEQAIKVIEKTPGAECLNDVWKKVYQ